MIWTFNSDRASASSCENYDDLFQYITEKESFAYFEFDYSWSFTFFTCQQVSIIYDNIKQSQPTEIIKQAHERELGLIKICHGDPHNSIEILATPDIDIEALKKEWCLKYCEAHHYIVVEGCSTSQNSLQDHGHLL